MNMKSLIESVNRALNSSKKTPPYNIIYNIIRGKLQSKETQIYFGNYFGNTVYRYTKKLQPVFTIKENCFGRYIDSLQFYGDDYFEKTSKENLLENLNRHLEKLNYEEMANQLTSLKEIEDIKFI